MRRDEVKQWLAAIFDEPVGNLKDSTLRDEIFGWDSLGTLSLMAEMDEKFDIQLTEKDIQELQSVGNVLVLLESRGKLTM